MKPAWMLIALSILSGAAARCADSPATPPSVPPAADVQDLVVLAPGQPLVVRLHIQLDGQPYQSTWGDYLWERFSHSDTNGDGVLDNDEFQLGDWQTLVGQGRDAAGRMVGQRGATSFLDLDNNPPDEAITFTELVEHLGDRCFALNAGGGSQVLGLAASPAATPSSPDVRDALLVRLDGDNNGQLTRDEIAAALGQLYRFDLNEDELLTDLELRADGNPFANRFVSREGRPLAQTSPALAPIPGATADGLARAVFLNYDLPQSVSPDAKQPASGDGQLASQELRIAPEQFALADADSSGMVSEAEFAAWLAARPIDVELSVNLDADVAADERVRVASASSNPPSTLAAAPNVAVEAKAGKLTLRLGGCELVVSATGATHWDKQRASYESLFKRFDADQNGYLDEQEVRNLSSGRGQFARIDGDRDGKVFLEEYLRYHESTQKLTQRRVTASVSDQGSRLLEIVDANANGQLSIRELRTVPTLVASWDANGDGQVAPNELPRRYQIQIAPGAGGSINGTLAVPIAFGGPMSTAAKLTGKGPDWFQRMDRNGDEDLSRREFLGSRAAFAKLDADGDGLVDLKEAEAASASP
ncbi:MAG: hypothetical protein K2Y37_10540 [Pirellulales bacterium]|nr:hypothetical protein [Pirellulales bacterium]